MLRTRATITSQCLHGIVVARVEDLVLNQSEREVLVHFGACITTVRARPSARTDIAVHSVRLACIVRLALGDTQGVTLPRSSRVAVLETPSIECLAESVPRGRQRGRIDVATGHGLPALTTELHEALDRLVQRNWIAIETHEAIKRGSEPTHEFPRPFSGRAPTLAFGRTTRAASRRHGSIACRVPLTLHCVRVALALHGHFRLERSRRACALVE